MTPCVALLFTAALVVEMGSLFCIQPLARSPILIQQQQQAVKEDQYYTVRVKLWYNL
jgi:hypothetical protein